MTHMSSTRITLVWAFLVGLTLFSGWFHASHVATGALYGVILLFAASLKARMLIMYYMEIRHAPLPWRLAFELWLLVTTLALMALCFF